MSQAGLVPLIAQWFAPRGEAAAEPAPDRPMANREERPESERPPPQDAPPTPEIRRDPFWEAMRGPMGAAGTPGGARILDPGTEAGATGHTPAPLTPEESLRAGEWPEPWNRVAEVAHWFGNVLPLRGAMGEGDPALRAFLKRMAAKETDQAGSPAAAAAAKRMGPAQFPTVEAGGWQSESPITWRKLQRELGQPDLGAPNPDLKAKTNERFRTRELEDMNRILDPPPGHPIGPSPSPFGPADFMPKKPWGSGLAYGPPIKLPSGEVVPTDWWRTFVGKEPGLLAPNARVPSEPGFQYHATNLENAQAIADSGRMTPQRPWYGTEQTAWPDGGVEKRIYFTPKAETAHSFAPAEGQPVLLRVSEKYVPHRESGTGDTFARQSIPAQYLEVARQDGSWVPLTQAFPKPK